MHACMHAACKTLIVNGCSLAHAMPGCCLLVNRWTGQPAVHVQLHGQHGHGEVPETGPAFAETGGGEPRLGGSLHTISFQRPS